MKNNEIVNILYNDNNVYSLDDPRKVGFFTHLVDSQNLLHSHTYWEIFYITRGAALHHIDNNSYWLMPGKMYIVKPGVIHSLADYQEGHLAQHRDICIADDMMQRIASSVPAIAQTIEDRKSSIIVLSLSHEEQVFFEDKLKFYEACEDAQKILVAPFLIDCIGAQLLHNCLRIQRKTYNEKFERILKLVQNKIVLEQGLSALVELSSYSRSQLHRLFIKNTNKTPLDVITDLRMETAATLLSTTDYSIDLISESLGYNSLSHFTKIFKKYYLISPYKYRSQNS